MSRLSNEKAFLPCNKQAVKSFAPKNATMLHVSAVTQHPCTHAPVQGLTTFAGDFWVVWEDQRQAWMYLKKSAGESCNSLAATLKDVLKMKTYKCVVKYFLG